MLLAYHGGMNSLELLEYQQPTTIGNDLVVLPYGMLGFERVKNYTLLKNTEEEPFLWLEMLDNCNYAFLLLPPDAVVPDYRPQLTPEDMDFLELEDLSDAFILTTVTVKDEGVTMNLKGPIVINRRTWIGKQVVPVNANDYSAQYPLDVDLC